MNGEIGIYYTTYLTFKAIGFGDSSKSRLNMDFYTDNMIDGFATEASLWYCSLGKNGALSTFATMLTRL
jgi:hypothetical protein